MIPPINRLVWFLNIQYNKSKLIFLTFAKSLVSISSRFTAVCFKTSATLTEMVAIPAQISAGKYDIMKPGTGIWDSHFFDGSLAEKNTYIYFLVFHDLGSTIHAAQKPPVSWSSTSPLPPIFAKPPAKARKNKSFASEMAPFAWCNPRW